MSSNIDQVIARLETIVAANRAAADRAGFFAAMYLAVTREIKHAIDAGVFEDGARMDRFDQVFAQRYIDAYADYRSGVAPTTAWRVAFDATDDWRPIIVQQLLAGMNAHINLDLGIAAATVAPGEAIGGLKHDFDQINQVLAGMTAGFMADVQAVSPWIKLLDRIGGSGERVVIRWSIDIARDRAWVLATELAALPAEQWSSHLSLIHISEPTRPY